MGALILFLQANPELVTAGAGLVTSLAVALSRAGGEKFALLSRLVRLVRTGSATSAKRAFRDALTPEEVARYRAAASGSESALKVISKGGKD